MDLKNIQEKMTSAGLKYRETQFTMIEHIFNSLRKQEISVIEAPTGTGKTLGYLLASYFAKNSKQPIIVSTATIALQEQLIQKDLPLLEKLLGEKIRYALAKGRKNYLCLAKFQQEEQQGSLLNTDDDLDNIRTQVESQFWDGDKENLSRPLQETRWNTLTVDSAGCNGRRCEFYDNCYFYKARSKMHGAKFIVTNHNLLLSDLTLGGGVLLPEPKDNIYIIDECHHLAQQAIGHFAKSSSVNHVIDWINQMNASIQRAISAKVVEARWQNQLSRLGASLVEGVKQLKDQLDCNRLHFSDFIWRIKEKDVEQFDIVNIILSHTQQLKQCNEAILAGIESDMEITKPENNKEGAELLGKHHSQFKFLLSRLQNFHDTWDLFCHKRQAKEPPIARWFEFSEKNGDFICHCSPINISQQLKTLFWDRVSNGALLCSATVRSLGSFDHFLRKTGLKSAEQVNTKTLAAIFNYKDSIIFIPSMQSEPSGINQNAHRLEAINLLPDLILPKSGSLVLFSSKKAMEETYHQMPPDILFDVLMQGKISKNKLITQHKARIKSGKRSVIFGLSSFAEGIDLPADYCQHVIIHKLPFAVPSTPTELTRSEWISQHKLDPFKLATLPETSIKLTQYVGRLIRQESDIGIVTILDRRLYSKSYGKQLMRNLPEFTQLINCSLEQLKKQPSIKMLFELNH